MSDNHKHQVGFTELHFYEQVMKLVNDLHIDVESTELCCHFFSFYKLMRYFRFLQAHMCSSVWVSQAEVLQLNQRTTERQS